MDGTQSEIHAVIIITDADTDGQIRATGRDRGTSLVRARDAQELSAHVEPRRPGLIPQFVSTKRTMELLIWIAMATSSFVLFEPAPVDLLMAIAIVLIPMLGCATFGRVSLINLIIWLSMTGVSIIAVIMATSLGTALSHQIVTLFLAIGAFVLAGFIAKDPEFRFELVFSGYLVGATIAAAAGIIGYFNLLPGSYDLFTNYGRARGTFKDPNVLGAALAPAFVYLCWIMVREKAREARFAMLLAAPLAFALLIGFSRGAWISVALSVLMMGWIALVTSRRKTDFSRLTMLAGGSIVGVVLLVGIAMQVPAVQSLMNQRASMDQGYDNGPDGRFAGQKKARRLILENPFGIGTHTFRNVHHHEEAHSVYLSMFLNGGWYGGYVYIISCAIALVMGFRGAMRRGALQGAFVVATASFAGVAFEGWIVDTDHWRHFFILLGCIWGLSDAAPPQIDSRQRRDD
jgi:O-antigen ligase